MEFILKEVDAGCFMFEQSEGRWIIEHPRIGYKPTISGMWDVIIEHPYTPHQNCLKFMGSFNNKIDAITFIKSSVCMGITYFNASTTSNKFYHEDYTSK